jgi:hypothetical protein
VRKADKTVDDSGTSQVNGDAVGVGAVTGSFIFVPPLSMAIGGGGTAPRAEKGGGGVGELAREEEGPETGARVDVMILRREARPPKFALRFRFRPCWGIDDGGWRVVVGAEVWYGAGAVPFNLHTGTNP